MRRLRVAVLFDRFGPYHVARLAAAAERMEVVGIEVAAQSAEYAWDVVNGKAPFRRLTLFDGDSSAVPLRRLIARVEATLTLAEPDVVAVHGWADPAALAALRWALGTGIPAVMMSETTAYDAPRRAGREWVKRVLVGGCRAALVGGTPHAAYAEALGVPRERIFLGYDAVDNAHFAAGAAAARAEAPSVRAALDLPEHYVLASNRFIPKKNLARLLAAYAGYRERAGDAAWDLVLLGDGPLAPAVRADVARLGLQASVHLPGFRQYDDLPAYYGLAGAFVHASTVEQWGLVVNEAMAAGLPVLVSDRVGCAPDLVAVGENGYTFDPTDTAALSERLHHLAHGGADLHAMGQASARRIADWGPSRFAEGLDGAARAAAAAAGPRIRLLHRSITAAVLQRGQIGSRV